uniref:Transmembrane protein 107 n=1 Tax=Globodera rostochiensis TaxID=31243 RepID=A0A914H688_GLORO
MDLDTNCLLTAVAQSCIAFTTFFNRNDHIVASLAPSTELTRNSQKMLYGDTDASLCIVLALSLAFLASECVLHLSIVQSPQLLQMYCLSAHTVACLCLLKFIVDAHPVHHFWWLFSLTNCPITKELAELTTHAERFVGLEGGGMDQACECLARRGEALRIDFRPLGWRAVRLPDNALFAVLHSNTEMNKTASAFYNQRVVECRIAAQVISKRSGCVPSGAEWHSVRTLKQVAALLGKDDQPEQMLSIVDQHLAKPGQQQQQLVAHSREEICAILNCTDAELAKWSLNANTQNMHEFWLTKRARHVYAEAARVLEFESVCREERQHGNDETLGKLAELMNASHLSCAQLFECSCPELDETVANCLSAGCIGARLTGAGWGGCAVALVAKAKRAQVEASGLNVLFWSEPCEGIEAFPFRRQADE